MNYQFAEFLNWQKNCQEILDTTRKWMEVLRNEPYPPTALTPKTVVWRKNKAKLYRYKSPYSEYAYRIPILMTYALINKPYILDLTPGMSVVEHLLQQGFDVYLLDWGEFAWEDRDLSFADLVEKYISRAIRQVMRLSGSEHISLLGYCMGGTMNAMYAGLKPRPELKNMVFLATPIDFATAALSGKWFNFWGFDIEEIYSTLELIPSQFIDLGVKLMRPVDNFWGTYTRLWKLLDEDKPYENWMLLDKWVNDNMNFPGKAFLEWVKNFYQNNELVKGLFTLNGKPVDLKNIAANILVLAGKTDHLVLPPQTEAIIKSSSAKDSTFTLFPIGHGGLVFGSRAVNEVYPYLADWLKTRS